jgi:hypothetical protein
MRLYSHPVQPKVIRVLMFIDETSGEPFLFGNDVRERAEVAMWERRLRI